MNRRRIHVTGLILLACTLSNLSGQTTYYKYWIEFSGKDNTPYTTDHPEEYLSERAIQRRENQGIDIKMNDLPVDPDYVTEIETIGGRTIHRSRWFNAILYETTDSFDVDEIAAKDFVKAVHAMYGGDFSFFSPPSGMKKSAGEDYYGYGHSKNQIRINNGQRLHNDGYRGKGMLIAILDAGFYNVDSFPAFDSLWTNGQIVGYKDFVHKDNNLFREHSHGMSVLSLMGGNIPGKLVGTAPEADFLLLRSEDINSECRVEEINWIAAAEYADSAGADLINSSLGYSDFDNPDQDYTYEDMDGNTTWVTRGADIAASKGILVVASAGNEGNKPWKYIIAPADADSVLAVGSVDSLGQYSPFSSMGPTYDGRIKPNVMAQGSKAWVQDKSGQIKQGNGTSFAAPIMTGLTACLWQRFPDKTNYEIIEILEQSSSKYPYPNDKYGYGIPNMGVATDMLTGEKDLSAEPGVRLYPNPSSDHNIRLVVPEQAGPVVRIQIFDVTGKWMQTMPPSVLQGGPEQVLYLPPNIQPGMYILRITTEKKILALRLIMNE